MIGAPLNDETCLDVLSRRAADYAQRSEVRDLAGRFETADELATFLRELPQRNDSGDPDDGPRVPCGDTSQRVRPLADDPNCVERSTLYLAAAELIDGEPLRQLATIDTPLGRHTFPVEDGRAVVLDPRVPRNALALGAYQIRNASGDMHDLVDVFDLIGQLATDAAKEMGARIAGVSEGRTLVFRNAETLKTSGRNVAGAHGSSESGIPESRKPLERVRNGSAVLSRLLEVGQLEHPRNSLDDLGFMFAMAEQGLRAMGGKGVDVVRVGMMAADKLIRRAVDAPVVGKLDDVRNASPGSLWTVRRTRDQHGRRRVVLDRRRGYEPRRTRKRKRRGLRLPGVTIPLPSSAQVAGTLGAVVKVGGRVGGRVLTEVAKKKLESLGVTPEVLVELDKEFSAEGRTLGPIAKEREPNALDQFLLSGIRPAS